MNMIQLNHLKYFKVRSCYVDWRTFNIVLWSKCYCRYDQNYMPTLREQQLSFEISCLQEDIKKAHTKSRRHITIDTFHSVRIFDEKIKEFILLKFFQINHANSWHPQSLDTHV